MTGSQIIVAAVILASAGIWLMLPRPSPRGRLAGVVMTAAALGLLASQMSWLGRIAGDVVFTMIGAVTIVAALATVTCRSPLYCAIWFGMTLLGTAGLLMFQGAQFVAVATVVVYAGAILVTFLFVLMLADSEGRTRYDRTSWEGLVSAATGAIIVGVLSLTVVRVFDAQPAAPVAVTPQQRTAPGGVLSDQHVATVGRVLFGPQLIAVEVAGTLLLVALVGAAVIVAHSRGPLVGPGREEGKPQEDLSTPPTQQSLP